MINRYFSCEFEHEYDIHAIFDRLRLLLCDDLKTEINPAFPLVCDGPYCRMCDLKPHSAKASDSSKGEGSVADQALAGSPARKCQDKDARRDYLDQRIGKVLIRCLRLTFFLRLSDSHLETAS